MLSLVLPTYNEARNLPAILPRIKKALHEVPHEIIIVDDDSPDHTWKIARELAEHDPHMHVIRRVGRRGLSSAVIEGFLSAKGNVLAVADADGQHDFNVLPRLYGEVKGGMGIAIGSRYVEGGNMGNWDERRYVMSQIATSLAIRLCKVRVHDPMSGFFAIDRRTFEWTIDKLNPKGFKILLDLLVHVKPSTKVIELPINFGTRLHGESKLSGRVQLEFLEYLYEAVFGRFIPLTFVKYSIVGTMGVAVNLAAYFLVSNLALLQSTVVSYRFTLAVLFGVEAAIIFNFLLNNAWTFAQARLHGRRAISGFLRYNAACLFGAIAAYSVTVFLFSSEMSEVVSVIMGAMVGVVWNYTMSRIFTWKV